MSHMRSKYNKHTIPFTIDLQSHRISTASRSVGTSPIERFIDAYRRTGYRVASIDPLGLLSHPDLPELTAEHHGLMTTDRIVVPHIGLEPASSIGKLQKRLKSIYCGAIGLDCGGVRDEARQRWLFDHMESLPQDFSLVSEQRRVVLSRLLSAEMWERNVANLFGDAKRFSLEGCESLIPLLDAVIESAGHHAVNRMFLGMHHRGRLNALVNLMGLPSKEILASLDSNSDLDFQRKDLLYHLGGVALKKTPYGDVSVMLAHNPSHLESVYPVVAGMARAYRDDHPESDCIAVIVHGDAAFAGQGIVMETLMLTRRKGYSLGGVIHIIINNQVGGTTPNEIDRDASVYCTDMSRAVDLPVLHVNADHPDAVVTAAKLAFEYRKKFSSDIVIDLIGYRRFGHFEQDIAAITQPGRQRAIDTHPTVTELYHKSFDAIPRLISCARKRFISFILETKRPTSVLNLTPSVGPIRTYRSGVCLSKDS